jgi:hypothetical protein
VAQNRTNPREGLLSQSVACAVVYGIPNGPPARPADRRSATRARLTAPPRITAPRRAHHRAMTDAAAGRADLGI